MAEMLQAANLKKKRVLLKMFSSQGNRINLWEFLSHLNSRCLEPIEHNLWWKGYDELEYVLNFQLYIPNSPPPILAEVSECWVGEENYVSRDLWTDLCKMHTHTILIYSNLWPALLDGALCITESSFCQGGTVGNSTPNLGLSNSPSPC